MGLCSFEFWCLLYFLSCFSFAQESASLSGFLNLYISSPAWVRGDKRKAPPSPSPGSVKIPSSTWFRVGQRWKAILCNQMVTIMWLHSTSSRIIRWCRIIIISGWATFSVGKGTILVIWWWIIRLLLLITTIHIIGSYRCRWRMSVWRMVITSQFPSTPSVFTSLDGGILKTAPSGRCTHIGKVRVLIDIITPWIN